MVRIRVPLIWRTWYVGHHLAPALACVSTSYFLPGNKSYIVASYVLRCPHCTACCSTTTQSRTRKMTQQRRWKGLRRYVCTAQRVTAIETKNLPRPHTFSLVCIVLDRTLPRRHSGFTESLPAWPPLSSDPFLPEYNPYLSLSLSPPCSPNTPKGCRN